MTDQVTRARPFASNSLDPARLAEYCRSNGIRKLSLFGSALGDGFRDDSDLDLLVEFEPGRTPGLAFFRLQDELTSLVGRSVDLNTPESLSPRFRDDVLRRAKVLYDAG
ncbi:MAG: nucleotidyltransferase [Isosphaeraceae bacterium]